jgi:hypothetical protein
LKPLTEPLITRLSYISKHLMKIRKMLLPLLFTMHLRNSLMRLMPLSDLMDC